MVCLCRRGYIEESTASSTRHMLREPQPYEEARPSISGMITSSDEYPAVNGSSSMSSTKYNYIKKERVKPYKTVSLESTETLGSESGDAGYSVVLNPPLEAAVSDVGYSVVQSPPSETGASDVGYSVVQSPTLEADATLSTEDGYLVVPSPNLTTDYLNVSSADHSLQVSTIPCVQNYQIGPQVGSFPILLDSIAKPYKAFPQYKCNTSVNAQCSNTMTVMV